VPGLPGKEKENVTIFFGFFCKSPVYRAEDIEKLEGKDKELIDLREVKGLSYEAIANRLKMPVGSVTSGIFRARQKLIERVREKMPQGWEEANR
jgi:hypothetical protein